MKNIYAFIAPLCMSVLSLSSCISDDEVVTSSECGIISFSVGDIKSALTVKNASGEDTVVYRTIGGSEIKFNIDQVKGKIYSVDTLPNWTDLSAVVPKFSAYGYMYGQTKKADKDSTYYYVTSGSDSLDLRTPMEVYVVATDGVSKKKYTIEMYKYTTNTDTLEWTKGNTNIAFGDNSKFAVNDGKLYAFYEKDGEVLVSETTTGTEWTTKSAGTVKSESVTTFNGKFYALGEDSYIYSSADGSNWEKVSTSVVEHILAADKFRLYAFDGSKIIGSSDMETWDVYGEADVNMVPTKNVAICSFTSKTNKNLELVTMVGLSDNNLNNSVSWYKVSADDSYLDQNWTYTKSSMNIYPFPYLEGLSVTAYDGAIFAIGMNKGEYDYIYRSDDNGISWHPLTNKYPLPEGLNEDNKADAVIVTIGKELWIVKGSNIWKGVME